MNTSFLVRWICLLLAILPLRSRAADANDATAHFQSYLASGGTNEIRCLWFLDNRPNVAMVNPTQPERFQCLPANDQSRETRTRKKPLRLVVVAGTALMVSHSLVAWVARLTV